MILTAYGRRLVAEGGVYTYDASIWRRWVLSSHAHNVVLVDGLGQNRRASPRETWVRRAPAPLRWATNAEVAVAEATDDEGWGPDARRIATHTRRVVYRPPDLFVIRDRLVPADSGSHRYEALVHLDAADAEVVGSGVRMAVDGVGVHSMGYGTAGVSLVKGQTNPVVLGWLPDSSRGYGGVRPIPTAVFRKEAAGPAEMAFAIRPHRGAKTAAMPRWVEILEDAVTIEWPDGTRRHACRSWLPSRQ